MACQRTLRGPVRLTGVALHSGADAVAEILPAPPGTGVVFRVTACAGQWVDIPADLSHAGESPRIARPVYVSVGQSHALAVPGDELRLSVGTEFRTPVGRSVVDLVLDPESFRSELAAARTPGFVEEWMALKGAGLALGASEENVLVVLENGFGVPPRWPDEVGRHKALDLVGDLALLGVRLHACVATVMGGHALNRALVREIQGTVSLVE